MAARPNILLLQADQLSASALACYGNPFTKTPHIDRLAGTGVVFEGHYCNFPLCAPSRFSMMTGQLASRIGAYDNGAELPSAIPTFAHYLRAQGYRTCLSGKMHFVGADQLHGFDERLTSDIYPGDFAWTADWDAREHTDAGGPDAGVKSGRCTGSVQIDYDEQVAGEACAWFDGLSDGTDAPFLLTVSFTHPHDPFACTEEFWSLYDDVEIPLPTTPTVDDPHSQAMRRQYAMEGMEVSDDQVRNARRAYYGATSYVDAKMGQVLGALERSGQADNTIVIITSDHGEMLGDHGLWMKKVFYENALKIPMIVTCPERFTARRLSGLVSLVDLLPTMMGLVGDGHGDTTSLVEPLDGVDLSASILRGTPLSVRPLLAELTCEGTPGPVLMLRRGALKYIWSAVDPPILFDLETDPEEVINIAGESHVAEAEAALRHDITQHWDAGALACDVRLSQQRRLFVQQSHHAAGTPPDWDYRESGTPDTRWMRSNVGYNAWAYGSITDLEQ
ncbi:MAG: choline-sulfatase [Alphaproteobacteria bacterium]|nr:choline-sulfatase [Alphaproteobacteria bacterium]